MTRSVQLVRLLAAAAIAFGACFFVWAYDNSATVRYASDHPGAGYRAKSGEFVLAHPMPATEFIAAHRTHACAVPVVGLLAGILLIWRRPRSYALLELVVSGLWVLSLAWAGFVILMWEVQNIPMFRHMQWVY